MSNPCPKYTKYLSKSKNEANKNDERLIFPSKTEHSIESYNGERNLNHTTIFDKKCDFSRSCSEMKYQYNTPMLSLIKDTIGVRKQLCKKNYWRKFPTVPAPDPQDDFIYNTEYTSNYTFDDHRYITDYKYPLYGIGSSPTTFHTNYYGCSKPNHVGRCAAFLNHYRSEWTKDGSCE